MPVPSRLNTHMRLKQIPAWVWCVCFYGVRSTEIVITLRFNNTIYLSLPFSSFVYGYASWFSRWLAYRPHSSSFAADWIYWIYKQITFRKSILAVTQLSITKHDSLKLLLLYGFYPILSKSHPLIAYFLLYSSTATPIFLYKKFLLLSSLTGMKGAL